MVKQASQVKRNLSEGIIQPVDYSILPANCCYLAVNLVFNKLLGRAIVRDGLTQLGNQIIDNKTCLGVYSHITTAGSVVPLAVFNASGDATAVLSKYTSSTWSNAQAGLTKDLKMRFETYLDTTIAVNGVDAISSADGATWITSGGNLDVANMPKGNLVREFLDRVYVAGVSANKDRIYFSGISDGNTVSWTVGNGYIDIEPEEGKGAISALAKVPGYLLIFKERALKRWDGSSTYPESLIGIGALSQESVVMTKQSCYYFNKRGIYTTTGGYPIKISKKIQDIIDAIPSSYYQNISGWGDEERVFFSIGNISIMDLNLTNCVVMYDIDSQTWTLLSFPNEFRYWANYVDSNKNEFILAGDTDGNIMKVMNGAGDLGEPINYLLQYHADEFNQRGRTKNIQKIVTYTKMVRNGILKCRTDEKGDFDDCGNIKNDVEEISKTLNGHYFEFRLQGSGINCQIIGLEFPDLNINLNFT